MDALDFDRRQDLEPGARPRMPCASNGDIYCRGIRSWQINMDTAARGASHLPPENWARGKGVADAFGCSPNWVQR